MKNSFKITDTKIVITLFTLAFAAFITVAVLNPGKQEIKPKNFVGIDAAGFKHYPDGHMERMEVKFK
ncbi:hypothetical protein [Chryseobacterium sp.]|jgi:hypothetical protein|uniref:hypothetical protein n=1 Tax=Chryseobacterium sp. TaxID=1871047 RepID=UPI0028483D32|nr:hypothetical protein [Chryseobacterium sp.]MDR3026040.1 hypothetical protein [Chryseobacterium sp.]